MKVTLLLGDTTVRGVRAIFGPKGAHDRMGPPGKLVVPVYLKAIFGRGLRATLGGLEPPEGWSPPWRAHGHRDPIARGSP
jgi:hypothetical protein